MPLFFSGKGTPGTLGPVCYILGMRDEGLHRAPGQTIKVTDPQERFAMALAHGLPATVAARVAGYSAPHVTGPRLALHEGVRERVHAMRTRKIGRMATRALGVLDEILRNPNAPTSDRRQAAVHVLALAGHVPAKEAPQDLANLLKGKKITEYTAAELEAFIDEEKARRASAARPVIDQLPANQGQTSQIEHTQATDIIEITDG